MANDGHDSGTMDPSTIESEDCFVPTAREAFPKVKHLRVGQPRDVVLRLPGCGFISVSDVQLNAIDDVYPISEDRNDDISEGVQAICGSLGGNRMVCNFLCGPGGVILLGLDPDWLLHTARSGHGRIIE